MFYVLMFVGAIAVAAGVALVGFSIPIRESPLGAALLVVASVGTTGGFVLIGLAAALRELHGVAKALRALRARAPANARPPRPVENWPQERRDGADRWPASARAPASGRASVAPPADFQPIDLDAPPPAAAPVRNPAPERLRRTMTEIDSDRQPSGKKTQGPVNFDVAEPAIPPIAVEPPPLSAPGIWPWSAPSAPPVTPEVTAPAPRPAPPVMPEATAPAPRPAPPVMPEATAPAPRPAPPAAPADVLTSRPNLLESQQKMFESMWPASRRHDGGQDKQDKQHGVPVEPTVRNGPVSPVVPTVAPDPELPRILKTGVIEDLAYTLYSDGSIIATTPDRSTQRFRSIDELRQYLDRREA